MITRRIFILLMLVLAWGSLCAEAGRKAIVTTQNRCFITYRHEWLHYSLAVISGIESASFNMLVNESSLAFYSSADSSRESGEFGSSIYDRFLSQFDYYIRQSDLTGYKTMAALQAEKAESRSQAQHEGKELSYGQDSKTRSDYEVSASGVHSVTRSAAGSEVQKTASETAQARAGGRTGEVEAGNIGYSDQPDVSGATDLTSVAGYDEQTKSESRELATTTTGSGVSAQNIGREEIGGVVESAVHTDAPGSAQEIQQVSYTDNITSVSSEILSTLNEDFQLSGQEEFIQQPGSLGYAQIPMLEFVKNFIATDEESTTEEMEYAFSIQISNTGDLDLYDVNVYDILPENLEIKSYKSRTSPLTTGRYLTVKRAGNVFTIADFPVGQSITINYICRLKD